MTGPIVIVDEITVRGVDAKALREHYMEEYAPTARARGLTLEQALISPPVILDDGENVLTFLWSTPDLPGWWQMRVRAAYDPSIGAFWTKLDTQIIRRRRTFHVTGADHV